MTDLNCFPPKTTTTPKIGDIFFGEPEFIIGRKKIGNDKIIEVSVTKDECIIKEEKIETMVSKNKMFTFPRIVKTDTSVIDETRKNATWVVEFIEAKESVELLHSILPESYMIRARRLKDSNYDPEGEVIEFYTCGRFPNTYDGVLEVMGNFNKTK